MPNTEVTTRTVRAEDGTTCEVRVHRRLDDPSAPVLVCMPAMGTRAAYYTPLAEALSAAGFQVVVGELRGQGTSSVRPGRGVDYGYHEMVAYDCPALFALAATEFPASRRHLLGHSLGGQLGMLHLSREPKSADGAILVGAPSCHYRGWPPPRGLGMLVGLQLASAAAALYGRFPGRRLGVLGDDSAGVVRDLAFQSRTGSYQVPSTDVDFEALLTKLDLPVLAVTVEGDQMAPRACVQNLCDKLPSASVTHFDLPLDATHRNPHYAWVRENAPLVERIRRFITA